MRIILVLTFIVDGPGTCDFRKTCATQEERFKVKQCPRNRNEKNKLEVVSKIATTSPTEENVKQASQQESKRRKCEISMTTKVQPKKM